MNFKLLSLRIKERIYQLQHRDTMNIKIEKYRLSGMKIGGGCRIFSTLSTPEPYLIEIGNNVTISTGVNLITHDNCAIKCFEHATDFVGSIKIGSNCFIGAGVIILPGVRIADNVIIGAGSVVTKSLLEAGAIACGNPAKPIGSVELLKEKYCDKPFCFRGLNCSQKRQLILNNPEKWIQK